MCQTYFTTSHILPKSITSSSRKDVWITVPIYNLVDKGMFRFSSSPLLNQPRHVRIDIWNRTPLLDFESKVFKYTFCKSWIKRKRSYGEVAIVGIKLKQTLRS
ncbi:hypothetical protein ACHQM5_023759 [Ranunculus cassubicifolius]